MPMPYPQDQRGQHELEIIEELYDRLHFCYERANWLAVNRNMTTAKYVADMLGVLMSMTDHLKLKTAAEKNYELTR